MMDIKEIFGRNLRRLRKSRGLTQADVGELSDMDPTYIGLIERGKRSISTRNVGKIADGLGIPYHVLFMEEMPDGLAN